MSNFVDKKYFLQHTHFDKTISKNVIKCRLIGGVVDVEEKIIEKILKNKKIFLKKEIECIRRNKKVISLIYIISAIDTINFIKNKKEV